MDSWTEGSGSQPPTPARALTTSEAGGCCGGPAGGGALWATLGRLPLHLSRQASSPTHRSASKTHSVQYSTVAPAGSASQPSIPVATPLYIVYIHTYIHTGVVHVVAAPPIEGRTGCSAPELPPWAGAVGPSLAGPPEPCKRVARARPREDQYPHVGGENYPKTYVRVVEIGDTDRLPARPPEGRPWPPRMPTTVRASARPSVSACVRACRSLSGHPPPGGCTTSSPLGHAHASCALVASLRDVVHAQRLPPPTPLHLWTHPIPDGASARAAAAKVHFGRRLYRFSITLPVVQAS
eukprot:scaffold1548_cov354-Prasinococcus_capsulatus_cf.AAC.2